MRFTLYPLYALADEMDDDPFDLRVLPFHITENVFLENVGQRFPEDAFEHARAQLGQEVVDSLRGVRYALIHRYDPQRIYDPVTHQIIGEHIRSEASETLVREMAACLRLIRPMRQRALPIRGGVRQDGTFDVTGFDIPTLHLLEVPEVQKLFSLRNCDAENLRRYAPGFRAAMQGEFWKFRMAVQFHELGHFQPLNWKARYLLWCSAIESIYTSNHPHHRGSLVATSRIKWFLGQDTSIYGPGDISRLLADPHISVGAVVGDLYEMRNFMAHGDRIPDPFFNEAMRQGFNGHVYKSEVLLEAASFIIRSSLLKILDDGLIAHFANAPAAEAFFEAHDLTGPSLRRA